MILHTFSRCAAITGFIACLSLSSAMPAVAASTTSKPVATASGAVTIDTVLSKVQARFANIKDITGVVDLEQVTTDGAVVKAQTTVQARLPNLLRLKFVKPETFAGAIYVIDRSKNQVMQYSPITEQVLISGIDQVISERYVPTTVEQLFSLPSPNDYDLTVLGTDKNLINISARPKKTSDKSLFQFWIDQNQWMVQRMKVYDAAGKLLFTITLSDIKLNQNLSDASLKKMPPGAISVYR